MRVTIDTGNLKNRVKSVTGRTMVATANAGQKVKTKTANGAQRVADRLSTSDTEENE